ncbi:hypothetical protein [Anoxynatronum buryatiense]|uniref:hypothetical protein n=1 Tax=Anoxynatronum buryatiense TaxID=489973 RepID=UPI0024B7D769|nr:hypothetical protein [Anoxynatronum buryatiense]
MKPMKPAQPAQPIQPAQPTIHRRAIEKSPLLSCYNRETKKNSLCRLAILETQQMEEVMALHHLVIHELENPDLYIPYTREEMSGYLNQASGLILGLYDEQGMGAFRVITWPGEGKDNLGHHLGIPQSQLGQVIQLEGTNVHPRYRGNGLQCLLTERALNCIQPNEKEGILLTAVSPLNGRSLVNMFTLGMHIAGLKNRQAQPARLVMKRDFYRQSHKWQQGPWIEAGDIESHQRLLAQGLEGHEASMNAEKRLLVRYGRPLLSHEGAVMR